HVLAPFDTGLAARGGLLDAQLGHPGLDGLRHAAELLDLVDDAEGLGRQCVGERLHEVRPAPGIDHLGDPRLELEDELGVAAEASVGRAMASSKEFVCRLCVPPKTAAMASMVVRMMLLNGSCSVRLAPDVWQCVRSISEPACLGAKCFFIRVAHRSRAARSFATSM